MSVCLQPHKVINMKEGNTYNVFKTPEISNQTKSTSDIIIPHCINTFTSSSQDYTTYT